MAWTMGERPSEFPGIPPLQVAVNDDGVEIVACGYGRFNDVTFEYRHGDITIRFSAARPEENWVDYDPTNKTHKNRSLGPEAKVLIDDSKMARPLSPDEVANIKKNISEFLTQEFSRFRIAVPPPTERVTFF